jgi:hypothetical protein
MSLSIDEIRAIRAECERLSVAYAVYIDMRRYAEFAALFGETGILAVGGKLLGQEAIAAAMAQRSDKLRSRHVLTNTLIDVHDAEHASGVTYLTLYRHFGDASLDPGPVSSFSPAAVGHYTDAFVLTSDGWRFAKRELSFAFQSMEYFARPATTK